MLCENVGVGNEALCFMTGYDSEPNESVNVCVGVGGQLWRLRAW